jgi:hypothetical protein
MITSVVDRFSGVINRYVATSKQHYTACRLLVSRGRIFLSPVNNYAIILSFFSNNDHFSLWQLHKRTQSQILSAW